MTTPEPDPVLQRLRALPRPVQDQISAARTLARAEAAFAAAPPVKSATRSRWPVPAALALWAALYVWGAVRELGRLFPAANPPASTAMAANDDLTNGAAWPGRARP